MTDQLRPIVLTRFEGRFLGTRHETGPKPELRWIPIRQLRIDEIFQRKILRRGELRILQIAQEFEWVKFKPVIVAPLPKDLFSIIDGQHGTTAAALRGIKEVPCQVVAADRRKQAEAFAAINGNVTAITPLQLHAARVAAGEPKALELAQACAEADVTICRYPVPANKMKVGETIAAGMLHGLLEKFGRGVFVSALCCLTKTRRGNVGLIRAQIVDALCAVLEADPVYTADRKRLIKAMQTFDFAAQFNAARAAAINEGCSIGDALVDAIGAHLESKLPVAA
jgi:hypothetical protein